MPGLREEIGGLRAQALEQSRPHPAAGRPDPVAWDGRGPGAYLDVLLVSIAFGHHLDRVGCGGLRPHLPRFLGLRDRPPEGLRAAACERFEREVRERLAEPPPAEALPALCAPFQDETDRKHWGKFYTPAFVVDHILDHTLGPRLADVGPEAVRLLEPSCGTGEFVLAAYDRLARAHADVGLDRCEAHRTILERNLFALDTDPAAVAVARMALALKCEETLHETGALPQLNVHCANALLAGLAPPEAHEEGRGRRGGGRRQGRNPRPADPDSQLALGLAPAKEGDPRQASIRAGDPAWLPALAPVGGVEGASFDVVVGNPPFGAKVPRDLDRFFRDRYEVARGRMETAALFVERSLAFARPDGGAVGLVMPHSFSRSGAYGGARRLLLDRAALTTLVDLGGSFEGVMFNTMAFTAVRGRGRGKGVSLHRAVEGRIARESQVPRGFFAGRDTLPMHVPGEWVETLQSIEMSAEPLRRIARIDRGVNLMGRASLLERCGGPDRIPVVRGKDIRPYGLIEPGLLPSISKKLGHRPASRHPEIVIQNISSVLEATLMPPGTLPIDTVNVLWLRRTDEVEKEYLIGLLNSRFLAFYFRNVLINHATLTIHLDDPVLGSLPIVVPSPSRRRKVVKAVTDLFAARRQLARGAADEDCRRRLEARIEKLRTRIDDLVEGIYGLAAPLARELREAPGRDRPS